MPFCSTKWLVAFVLAFFVVYFRGRVRVLGSAQPLGQELRHGGDRQHTLLREA